MNEREVVAEFGLIALSTLTSAMKPARHAFKFGDDLHGANFRRTAHRAGRKRRAHQVAGCSLLLDKILRADSLRLSPAFVVRWP